MLVSPVFVCKGYLFSYREAQASSSDGEEKKPGKSASAPDNMPEMSADSKCYTNSHVGCTFNVLALFVEG